MIKTKSKPLLVYLFLLMSPWFMLGCSSEKDAAFNRLFHNTTGYYNAYYIGKEHIKEIEASIMASYKPDYDKILHIFPPLDSTLATTHKDKLEDCIKKASMVIQYHKISKWVDDSYNLIGQARMYGYDFPNAITTFKYVNTKGEDPDARHWAIVNLMRVFIETGDLANAEAASDFLEQEYLNKENLKYLYLTRAYYYQVLDDKDNMVKNLVLSVPLLSKPERARTYFIIGQVYQEIGFQSAAYEYYKRCIGSHPEYELSFYAKLNIASVTELKNDGDLQVIRKYFKKLVNDEKNIEFKDRIYYENARFELRLGNLDRALKNFNLSIRSSTNNPKQKGLSYLSLGRIYYDTLKDFSIAQAYYDSAVNSLPQSYEEYESIKKRSLVLDDFVTQINIITVQDSLLALADKDSATLMTIFMDRAQAEMDEQKRQEAKAEREARSQPVTVFGSPEPGGIGNSTWYFDNVSAVAAGRNSFRQIWGARPLEDHWRRSIKSSSDINLSNTVLDTAQTSTVEAVPEIPEQEQLATAARAMFEGVPKTEEEKTEALAKVEEAYYTLGNIYYFDLEEKDNAVTTFNTFLRRFPDSEYKPEVLYQLYLMQLDDKPEFAEQAKNELFDKYPTSIYSKLILNPKFEEQTNIDNEKLKLVYQEAYSIFLMDSLDSAYQILDKAIGEYPDLVFTSNLRLLQILIIGKTKTLGEYQLALKEFIDENPDHELNSYAIELLEASNDYRNSLVKLREAKYEIDTTDLHFYALESSEEELTKNTELLNNVINNNFADQSLSVGNLEIGDNRYFLIVRSFEGQERALLFYDMLKSLMIFDDEKYHTFVISSKNFDELYRAKEFDRYWEFFKENY